MSSLYPTSDHLSPKSCQALGCHSGCFQGCGLLFPCWLLFLGSTAKIPSAQNTPWCLSVFLCLILVLPAVVATTRGLELHQFCLLLCLVCVTHSLGSINRC
ncbi:rCG47754 [Rattus norvegicus]|uniref:RCG47754 n=1 Tax=Rattus norvegicus TaxID=10116 RepID=A6HYV8_RAT|nr:rCG47754 [Rattus norvegicus]